MPKLDKSGTVFVVDDDLSAREAVVAMVQRMGIPSLAFETGEDFLAGEHHHQPGCVISDLRLGGMNGLALLANIRQHGSRIPFILVSAYADVSVAVDAMERGAITILEKPYRAQVLWDSIVRSLQQDQEQRTLVSRRANLIDRLNALPDVEKSIVEMLLNDIPNKTVALRLQVSLRTVALKRKSILRHLQMPNMKLLIWHLGEIGWPSTVFKE
ncbi:MAG: response regulator transcription factor [Planctomycetes bacterium]|nr:response regulator transcription factor [Planctomycetota bacterium]